MTESNHEITTTTILGFDNSVEDSYLVKMPDTTIILIEGVCSLLKDSPNMVKKLRMFLKNVNVQIEEKKSKTALNIFPLQADNWIC